MQTYLIFGSQPELSLLEAETTLEDTATLTYKEVALFDALNSHPAFITKRLAGVVKTGTIIDQMVKPNPEKLAHFLASLLVSEERPRFGISIYDAGNTSLANDFEENKERLGMMVKKALKDFGTPSRLVTSRNSTLSAADIVKNDMIERGAEFVLICTETAVLVGQTNGVQQFEDWSHRDFGRPARDAKRGMLPPKLARTMINLAGKDPQSSTLLDPFCGVGTVLMEASLLDYKHVIGSDIDPKAIKDTKKNMHWVAKEYDLDLQLDLWESSAQNLNAILHKDSVDVMVFEPFLGNPRQGHETRDHISQTLQDLEKLYRESFVSLAGILKSDGVIVAAIPVHYFEQDQHHLPLEDLLHDAGLQLVQNPIHYHQSGQYVGRDISIIRKLH